MKRADTLDELAALCQVDPAGLAATVPRFNEFARTGVDADFHRGDSAYDRFMGDPGNKPNPCLAPLDRPPFYATALYPTDVGTCGGLLTDEHARVLNVAGQPIDGLYATGNITASVMGRQYPGAGASVGPACTFGFVAMNHLADRRQTPQPAVP
jgi:3-oxosteroid 1-dehydrogenase